MTKPWTPSKPTVALKPSRIRREPVPLQAAAKAMPVSREREIAGGIAGILLIAGALFAVIVGISAATFLREDPKAEAEANRFAQCYNAPGPNCVIDGETILVARQQLTIAGMDVPAIQAAQCDVERNQGIDAAVRLAELLNSGQVSVGPAFTDERGRQVRTVTVGGKDVAGSMIKEGLAHRPGGEAKGWCSEVQSDS